MHKYWCSLGTSFDIYVCYCFGIFQTRNIKEKVDIKSPGPGVYPFSEGFIHNVGKFIDVRIQIGKMRLNSTNVFIILLLDITFKLENKIKYRKIITDNFVESRISFHKTIMSRIVLTC